jgi:hypothetical protein
MPNRANDQRSPELAARNHDSLGAAPFLVRKPAGEDAGRIRIRAGFSRAEQEADRNQRVEPHASSGHRRKQRPTERDSRQHLAGADPVSHPSDRQLEEAIGHREGHVHIADVRVREFECLGGEFLLNICRCCPHANAVEVQNGRQGAEECQHA